MKKLSLSSSIFFILYSLLIGCDGFQYDINLKKTKHLPSISTIEASNVSTNSFSVSSKIEWDGDDIIISKGICFSTNANPTINDNIVTSNSSLDIFNTVINGLIVNTTYYFKSFITNSVGTSYSDVMSIYTNNTNSVLTSVNHCDSLTNLTTSYVYWNGTANVWTPWVIYSNGYVGSCIVADNPNLSGGDATGGYIEFEHVFNVNGFIKFWTKQDNPGSNNRIPDIYVDGVIQPNPPINVGGQLYSTSWLQLKTSNIPPGNHTIRISWPGSGGTYWYFKIDEIEFF